MSYNAFVHTDTDTAVLMQLPRLYHLSVALPHFKQWQLPEKFQALLAYMEKVKQHPAFKATDYGSEMIIKGWVDHGVPSPAPA
jgi:hypothetical protein